MDDVELHFFFFKQKTAYEMRISDWSSDVCSSDLAQVAYSVALRHLERRRIPLAEAVDGDGLSLAKMVADGHDVHAAVADDQANRHLHAAIESLPPLQRTLLTLYHLEELSIPEISRITGIAEGTIKSHLFRSRKQLRAILESSIGATA